MSNLRKEVIEASKTKALISAVVAPVTVMFVMYFINTSSTLVAGLAWYAIASLVYIIDNSKQLTAIYYFQNMKIVGVFVSPVVVLVGLGIYLSKFA